MTVPDYQSLMLPVLKAASAGQEVRIGNVVEMLADQLGLTEEDRNEPVPSGKQTKFTNRIHWAKTYMTKAGLLESTRRAHFKITERGLSLLAENPAKINIKTLLQFPDFIEFRKPKEVAPGMTADGNDDLASPDEVITNAHRKIELTLRKELLDRILSAPPSFFESVVVNLIVAMGFGGSVEEAGRSLGKSGDGGVDGVIDQDVLGLDRVYIQAKRYSPGNTVGAGDVRDFFGSLDTYRASKGVFVTTSTFSPAAREAAERMSRRMVLIDGDRLTALMIRHGVGVRVEETLYIKTIDEGFFPE